MQVDAARQIEAAFEWCANARRDLYPIHLSGGRGLCQLQRLSGSGMRCGGVRHGRRPFCKDVLDALEVGCDLAERAHAAKEFPERDKKQGEPEKRTS